MSPSDRGVRAAVLLAVAIVGLAGCGLGDKQGMADRITAASSRLERSGVVRGTVSVRIVTVKPDGIVPPGTVRILPVELPAVPLVIEPARAAAAVGLTGDEPSSAAILFHGSRIFQRLPAKRTGGAPAAPEGAASNVLGVLAAIGGGAVPAGVGAAETAAAPPEPSTTSTTEAHSALRRTPRIPRDWITFDYSTLDKRDDTKRGGSFAINPAFLLDLTRGVLTGSVEAGSDGGLTRYIANVNRDKAERGLSEDERELRDKMFRANAVGRRTFPARIWIDADGGLRRFEVKLRQEVTSVDRAELIVVIEFTSAADGPTISRPDPKATASVATLGQLVTRVAG